jgi:N-acetylglucosamine-6-phosphate deacetylase
VSVLGSLPEAQDGGGRLLGVHLEGPFISAHRRGAHDKIAIRDPDPAELRRLIEAGAGRIRLVTAAPELDRFAELADVAAANSVRLSAGHTDAPGDELLAAVRRGVRSLTHTFNGMRPCLHRDPGPLRVIADSTVVCELICDGIHVHPAFVRLLHRLAGPRRVVLVTDAVAFAGLPDGEHRSDGRLVHVRDRQVVVAGTSTLAGSTLTMAAAVKNYWQMTGADLGGLAAVSSGNAARMLGEDHRIAAIAPGRAADLVVLNEARDCIGVMASGRSIRMPDEPR